MKNEKTKNKNANPKKRGPKKGSFQAEYSVFTDLSRITNKEDLRNRLATSSCANGFRRYRYSEQRQVFGFPLFSKKCVWWVRERGVLAVTNSTNNDRSRRVTIFTIDELYNRILMTQEIR